MKKPSFLQRRFFCVFLDSTFLPGKSSFYLELQGKWQNSSYQDDKSEGQSAFKGEVSCNSFDNIYRNQHLKTEEYGTPYFFTNMRVNMFLTIFAPCFHRTSYTHQYASKDDKHTENLDDELYNFKNFVKMHRRVIKIYFSHRSILSENLQVFSLDL